MPQPELDLRERVTDVLLWPYVGDAPDGRQLVRYGKPDELVVRWLNKFRTTLNRDGNVVGIDVTLILDRAIEPRGIIWQGSLNDIPGTAQGNNIVPEGNLYEIVTADATGDTKGRSTRYQATLMRYGNKMPARGQPGQEAVYSGRGAK